MCEWKWKYLKMYCQVLIQVTVVEDGVAVRMGTERLQQLVEKLAEGKVDELINLSLHRVVISFSQKLNLFQDFTIASQSSTVRIEWVDPSPVDSQLVSPIDGQYLGYRFQYGLSLARVVTTALQVGCLSTF